MSLKLNQVSNKVYDGLVIQNQKDNAVRLDRCSNLTFQNCTFKDCSGEGLQILNSENIKVTNCVFENVRTGVYAVQSKNIHVSHCECKNVQGPMPRGQFVQFNKVTGPHNYIGYSIVYNELGKSYAEDAINLYKTHGEQDGWIIVEHIYINGGGPSQSGGGIMLGDNGGSYQVARHNVLVNPGQYGVACAGGEHISILNNQVYGKQQSFTNVGIYAWKQRAKEGDDVLIQNNQVYFKNSKGSNNPYWNGRNITNLRELENNWNASYQEPEPGSDLGVQSSQPNPSPKPNEIFLYDVASSSRLRPLQAGDVLDETKTIVFDNDMPSTYCLFYLNGELVCEEKVEPYTLIGDNDGVMKPLELDDGDYELGIKLYNGTSLVDEETIHFTFQASNPQPEPQPEPEPQPDTITYTFNIASIQTITYERKTNKIQIISSLNKE